MEKISDHINRVIALETQEDIRIWINRVLDDFIDSIVRIAI
jgi:hypothetical protein